MAKKSSMAALDVDDLRVDSLAKACSARLEKYASAAPDAIKDEALTRHVGYFLEANYGAQQSVDLGGVKEMQNTNHGAAFRRSGAMGLLSPWRSRGVGLVGDV